MTRDDFVNGVMEWERSDFMYADMTAETYLSYVDIIDGEEDWTFAWDAYCFDRYPV